MWPYDYFNAYSSVELCNEIEKIDKKAKLFIAMWFGGKKLKSKQNDIYKKIKSAIESNKDSRKLVIHTRTGEEKANGWLLYRLKAMRADNIKRGDLNINILGKIIESRLVICDITPMPNNDEINANVILELGIAMAWKMPEQVIILCQKNKENIILEKVSDIKMYHIDFINQNYQELKGIIDKRLKLLNDRNDILMKNIRSKLDGVSLGLLKKQRGLMFAPEKLDTNTTHTIRHLINLGVFRTEIFTKPLESRISFGYCFTDMGKRVLKDLDIYLYPDILIDIYLVRYWAGYPKQFAKKKKEFYKKYGLKFDRCLDIFVEAITRRFKSQLFSKYKDKLNVFNKYLEEYPFDFIIENTVKKWEKVCLKEIRKNLNK